MRAKDYSQAVIELTEKGTPEAVVFENLMKMLTKRGHKGLYPKILRHLEILLEKQDKHKTVTVTVAHEQDLNTHETAFKEAITSLEGTVFDTKIDPTITGGFIVEDREKRIDASYKKTLLTLYRSLIK